MAAAGADSYVYVDPPQFLRCVICMEVMRNPVSLSCGHSFCAACCHLTLAASRACPVCRQEVPGAPHPNIPLCQALDEQLVHCRFGVHRGELPHPVFELDPHGCTVTLRRFETPSHEKECPWRWVTCALSDTQTGERCPVVCHKKELPDHQAECPFRLVSCGNEGCDEQVSLRSVPRHVDLCLCETVQCENEGCPEYLPRKAMLLHTAHCPQRVAPCPFGKYGCQEKGRLSFIDDHVHAAQSDHLLLLFAGLEGIQRQQAAERRLACPKKRFKVVVHNFDEVAKRQVIDIDLDPSWKLKVWPNGEDKRHAGHISIRLFSREASSTFKVEGPYTLRIVHQGEYQRSITKATEAVSRFWADAIRGWGFPAFVKVDDVLSPDSGFLKDNTLVVEVEVTVSNVLEIVEYTDPEASSAPPSPPTSLPTAG